MHKTDQGVGRERPGLLKMQQQVHRQVLRNKTARHKEKNWMRTFKKKKILKHVVSHIIKRQENSQRQHWTEFLVELTRGKKSGGRYSCIDGKQKHIQTHTCTAAELCSVDTAQVGLHQQQPASNFLKFRHRTI